MSEDIFVGVFTGKFPKGAFDDSIDPLLTNGFLLYDSDSEDSTIYNVLKEFWIGNQHYPKDTKLHIHRQL